MLLYSHDLILLLFKAGSLAVDSCISHNVVGGYSQMNIPLQYNWLGYCVGLAKVWSFVALN